MPKFRSKYRNLMIMVKPDVTHIVNGSLFREPGEYITFENGEFVTEDKRQIAFLRKHKDFGISIFEDKEQAQG